VDYEEGATPDYLILNNSLRGQLKNLAETKILKERNPTDFDALFKKLTDENSLLPEEKAVEVRTSAGCRRATVPRGGKGQALAGGPDFPRGPRRGQGEEGRKGLRRLYANRLPRLQA
jgi:hypothetical protein